MTEQSRLLKKISAYKFSAWELHIFLDTHPDNCEAAKKLERTRKMVAELTAQYEAKYGPIAETNEQTSRWGWITGPWPWENGTEEDDD